MELTVNDPGRAVDGDSGDRNTQSPYNLETVKVKRVTIQEYATDKRGRTRTTSRAALAAVAAARARSPWEITGPNYKVDPNA